MVRATQSEVVTRRRLTADEFERMAEIGILHEDDHVELLDGELIQMAAMGGPHVACDARLNHRFVRAVGERAIVFVQSSIRLSDFSEPEPDIVVARYREDFFSAGLPRPEDILLIVEVADTTLRHDRTVKLPLYAAAGIPEVWLVDLNRRRVTVYRNPSPEGYRQASPYTRGAIISPLAFPDLMVRWQEIFGRT